jgi:manganese efflux pump family protein
VTGSQLLSVLVIALGLSMDCFAVALSGSIGLKSFKPVQVTRVALSFGLFQTVMPLLGWLAGQTVVGIIGAYDHWVAFILLAIIGGRMVWESFQKKEEETRAGTDFTRGLLLFTLSLATSIDALAAGLTFAFIKINIAAASGVIGIVAFLATVAGFLLGRRAGRLVGKRAETIGGIILFGIGLRILLTHIL